jgi:hypothetical protein
VTFTDDFSRKTWVFFMKMKDEVFCRFQEFRAQVENQTGKKIKVLRSDNGGEYNSNDFKDFCKEAGIKRELTVSYNPEQNGVADRKNRSIIGSAMAMIHDQELPMILWAEACNRTMYVQNMSPHRILGNKTSEEEFSGVKPEIGHLKIFGCPVYIHVLVEKRTKLEPSRHKGIFVGYNKTSKAYKIFIPVQWNTIVRKDVMFEENLASRRSQESSTVIEDKEQQAPKDEQQFAAQTSGGEKALSPSSPVRRPRWLLQTLRDVGEAPRSVVRERRPPRKFPN